MHVPRKLRDLRAELDWSSRDLFQYGTLAGLQRAQDLESRSELGVSGFGITPFKVPQRSVERHSIEVKPLFADRADEVQGFGRGIRGGGRHHDESDIAGTEQLGQGLEIL